MRQSNEEFTTASIDEQIEEYLRGSEVQHGEPALNTVMTRELKAMCTEDAALLERVRERYFAGVEQLLTPDVQPSTRPSITLLRYKEPTLQDLLPSIEERPSSTSTPEPPRKSKRFFLFAASLFITAFLVGGVLWGTSVFSRPSSSPTPNPVARSTKPSAPGNTKIRPVQDCPSVNDAAWNQVCNSGLVRATEQEQQLSNGVTLTLKGIYNDDNQVMLWYDATTVDNQKAFKSEDVLTTEQGTILPLLKTSIVNAPVGHAQWIVTFDTSSLPKDQAFVPLQAKENVGLTSSDTIRWGNAVFEFSAIMSNVNI